jgi:hypothetical protein
VVEYHITAKLDEDAKEVRGRMVLYWRNTTGRPARFLPFHLYMNAFKNESSLFMRESLGSHRGFDHEPGNWGFIEVEKVLINGESRTGDVQIAGCLSPPCEKPADRDETVMKVPLSEPVRPGEKVRVDMEFLTRLPRVFARTGYAGSFFMVAQWFPKIGVLEEDGWSCHPFHLTSEFYADFGVYNVELDLPALFRVGATGARASVERKASSRKVHRFVARDVHDFAFAAGPQMRIRMLEHAGTTIKLLAPASLLSRALDHLYLTRRALGVLERRLGPYPYPHLTVVVTPLDARGAAGMEYPTLFTTSVPAYPFPGLLDHEQTTIHELIHQYFQGMVANDEAEEPWLDEGLTTYMTGVVADEIYGAETSAVDLYGLSLGYYPVMRLCYRFRPDWDAVAERSWDYANMSSYGATVYCQGAVLLKSFEELIGGEKMTRLLRTYVKRWSFRHPTTDDFLAVVREVAGAEPAELLRRGLKTDGTLDHRVVAIRTRRVREARGYFGTGEEREKVEVGEAEVSKDGWESEIMLHRSGELFWPVEVEVTFSDGKKARRKWKEPGRWKRMRFRAESPAVSALLDPDRKVWVDTYRLNDGLTARADPAGARRVGARYGLVLQWLLQVVGF